jgi:hypothetical protein
MMGAEWEKETWKELKTKRKSYYHRKQGRGAKKHTHIYTYRTRKRNLLKLLY